jgi:septal ring factor EnvC (AmiA/AmiB activator)
MSLYAHLDSLARRTGERITPGTSVGRVGTSGGRETPALYFELRLRGNPIDPRSWLSRR